MKLGKLKRVPPRTVWFDEARSFTPWLAENLATLGEALGLDLELTGRETDVGNFSLDLLAKDLSSGGAVVIENQFGPTNHDHLGKILTYASGFDAKAVVWIAETFRDEHQPRAESYRAFFQELIDELRQRHKFTNARVAQP